MKSISADERSDQRYYLEKTETGRSGVTQGLLR